MQSEYEYEYGCISRHAIGIRYTVCSQWFLLRRAGKFNRLDGSTRKKCDIRGKAREKCREIVPEHIFLCNLELIFMPEADMHSTLVQIRDNVQIDKIPI